MRKSCGRRMGFQYPQSDRIFCNNSRVSSVAATPGFQYPQSDRIVCNQGFCVVRGPDLLSFSIRNRIESSATGHTLSVWQFAHALSVSAMRVGGVIDSLRF